jgi:hypothetical protein
MKKILSVLFLTGLLAMPLIALATPEEDCTAGGGQWNPTTQKCFVSSVKNIGDIIGLINKIGNWIFAAVLAISALFLIVAGFLFVTAGGNPENVIKARQMLINALIGVAIALAARGLVAVVTMFLG